MTAIRRLTAGHVEPWRGTVVDLTMADGSHRIGRVESIERGAVRLRAQAGGEALPDEGLVQLADATTIVRAARPR